jgi:hypothetical protein
VNIFVLDESPDVAAEMMCDKHVVKMIVESAQMLSTAHRVLDGEQYTELSANNRRIKRWKSPSKYVEEMLYKASFVGHPCTQWVMENDKNYFWLSRHAYALCQEYTKRYSKVHKSQNMLTYLHRRKPMNIPQSDCITPFAQAMPEEYKNSDGVKAYRAYYCGEKKSFAKWKNGNVPFWYEEILV